MFITNGFFIILCAIHLRLAHCAYNRYIMTYFSILPSYSAVKSSLCKILPKHSYIYSLPFSVYSLNLFMNPFLPNPLHIYTQNLELKTLLQFMITTQDNSFFECVFPIFALHATFTLLIVFLHDFACLSYFACLTAFVCALILHSLNCLSNKPPTLTCGSS
jgi:hypothetical protein